MVIRNGFTDLMLVGLYSSRTGESLYMEYKLVCRLDSRAVCEELKWKAYEYISNSVVNNDLDYLFPMGTGKGGLDFETDILNAVKEYIVESGIEAAVVKGMIVKYAMPDRLVMYKGMDIISLCEQFECDYISNWFCTECREVLEWKEAL